MGNGRHNEKIIYGFTLLCIISLLTGCADEVPIEYADGINSVGFLHGIWHGLILPIAFIMSLFTDTAIYAVYNNGGWYDFGFLAGVSASFGICKFWCKH